MLLTTAAVSLSAADALTAVASRDQKVIRRWALPGDPRGVAVGSDGTLYVGLAEPQAIVAIDPENGLVKKRVVLDSAEIASTKELVTLRTNLDRSRLFVANGSDESAVILSLPDLTVLREITMEGETVRDVIPDPKGRYVFVLGRHVHVFDDDGDTELRTLDVENPMAIAVSADGASIAVFAAEDFGNTRATAVSLFDTRTFSRTSREPLQTEKTIEAALFAAGGRSLVAFSRDSLFEKQVGPRNPGGLVNSNGVCLPEKSGPQIAALAGTDTLVVYAERRCSGSGAFSGSPRGVTPASLYGVAAYAVAFDPSTSSLVATDRAGFLTLYKVPRPPVVSP